MAISLPPDWSTIVLTVIAGFVGGAFSIVIAEGFKERWVAKRKRSQLLSALRREVGAYLERQEDLYERDEDGQVFAEPLICINEVDRILSSDAFAGATYDVLLERALEVRNAMIRYNNTPPVDRPAYAARTLLPRLADLRRLIEKELKLQARPTSASKSGGGSELPPLANTD